MRAKQPNPRIEEGAALQEFRDVMSHYQLVLARVAEVCGMPAVQLSQWLCGSVTFGPARLTTVREFLDELGAGDLDIAQLQRRKPMNRRKWKA